MTLLTDFLRTQRYPGRFIVIGKDGDGSVAVYGATGRSPSSLARKFVQKGNEIFMVAADDAVVKQGNEELLTYPAVRIFENGVVVANGRQINRVSQFSTQLADFLITEQYEPDQNHTPRITGSVEFETGKVALHIIRFPENNYHSHMEFPFSVTENEGRYIATYTGEDLTPTPSFSGVPVQIGVSFGSAKDAARAVFDALMPPAGQPDYRVGVVAVYKKLGGTPDIAIVNRV